MTIRVGLKLSQQVHSVAEQREAWRMADEAGFDHIWAFDHLLPIHQEPTFPIVDGWSLIAAMAEVTSRAQIGLNVTGNLYRHPALLAKMATTVDHLSDGRLAMGIGAGWNEPEFRMFGMDFPERPGERLDRLEEAVKVMKLLWTEPRASFAGRHYQLTDAIAEPKPVQKPHPPIWIGGNGPKRTLRIAAEHADVWSCDVWPTNAEAMEKAYALSRTLDEHCAAVGRGPRTIRRAHALVVDDPASLEVARRSRAVGFTDFLLVPVAALGPGGDLFTGVGKAATLMGRLRSLV